MKQLKAWEEQYEADAWYEDQAWLLQTKHSLLFDFGFGPESVRFSDSDVIVQP